LGFLWVVLTPVLNYAVIGTPWIVPRREPLLKNNGKILDLVRDGEANIKGYRKGMYQHWLGAVLLHRGEGFKKVKGYRQIKSVVVELKRLQAKEQNGPALKLAA
jgi:hypothetical protein